MSVVNVFEAMIKKAKGNNLDLSKLAFCISENINYSKDNYKGYLVFKINTMPKDNLIFGEYKD